MDLLSQSQRFNRRANPSAGWQFHCLDFIDVLLELGEDAHEHRQAKLKRRKVGGGEDVVEAAKTKAPRFEWGAQEYGRNLGWSQLRYGEERFDNFGIEFGKRSG
jgi:hypothetical protein